MCHISGSNLEQCAYQFFFFIFFRVWLEMCDISSLLKNQPAAFAAILHNKLKSFKKCNFDILKLQTTYTYDVTASKSYLHIQTQLLNFNEALTIMVQTLNRYTFFIALFSYFCPVCTGLVVTSVRKTT